MDPERRSLCQVALVAVAAALVVFPWLPGPWPNPLPEGGIEDPAAVQRLVAAAAAVDAACAAGDPAAFAAVCTTAHCERLSRQLAALGRELDDAALRELATGPTAPGRWIQREWLAAAVHGPRAAVVVPRAGDGVQLLAFAWDGAALRLDELRQVPGVADRAAAAAVVEAAVRTR